MARRPAFHPLNQAVAAEGVMAFQRWAARMSSGVELGLSKTRQASAKVQVVRWFPFFMVALPG